MGELFKLRFNKIWGYMNESMQYAFLNRKDFRKYKEEKIFLKLRNQVKEIAIYKGGGGLGDLIVGIPFFKIFKEAFPVARINYMGIIYPRFERIFKSIPIIDGYIEYSRPDKGKGMREYFDFRRRWNAKIDLLVDTQRRWETSFWLKMLNPKFMLSASVLLSDWPMPFLNYKKMHIFEQMLTLPARLGMQEFRDSGANLSIPEDCLKNAQGMLSGYGDKFIALLPSCGMEFKNWLPEYFARVGDLFAKKGYMVIILGSPKDNNLFRQIASQMHYKPLIPAEIDASFSAELLNDAAVLKLCDIAVGNDSGGMHLGSSLGCVSAAIFGPTTPRKFSLISPGIVFYKGLACSPCKFKCKRRVHRECLVSIKPEEVFEACMKKIEKSKA